MTSVFPQLKRIRTQPRDLDPPLEQPSSNSGSVEVVLNLYGREWCNDNTVQELVRQGQEQ